MYLRTNTLCWGIFYLASTIYLQDIAIWTLTNALFCFLFVKTKVFFLFFPFFEHQIVAFQVDWYVLLQSGCKQHCAIMQHVPFWRRTLIVCSAGGRSENQKGGWGGGHCFYADISWKSRCNIEIDVWTKLYFFDDIWVLYFVLFCFYAIQKVITFKVFSKNSNFFFQTKLNFE